MTPELNLALMTHELKWGKGLAFMAFWLS